MAITSRSTFILQRNKSLTNGLVFDIPFFEGSGSKLFDLAGIHNGGDGTSAGTTWIKGAYGNGLSFPSATTANIQVDSANNNFTSPYNKSFTYMALVKINSASAAERFMIHHVGNANSPEIYFLFSTGATNQVQFGFQDTTGAYTQANWTSGFTAGSTHLIFGVYDGVNQAIYADDDPAAKATNPNTNSPKQATPLFFFIGNRSQSGTSSFDGTIYITRIWNRALTAQERMQLWANPWYIYRNPSNKII